MELTQRHEANRCVRQWHGVNIMGILLAKLLGCSLLRQALDVPLFCLLHSMLTCYLFWIVRGPKHKICMPLQLQSEVAGSLGYPYC
jgi:hypothetical protein